MGKVSNLNYYGTSVYKYVVYVFQFVCVCVWFIKCRKRVDEDAKVVRLFVVYCMCCYIEDPESRERKNKNKIFHPLWFCCGFCLVLNIFQVCLLCCHSTLTNFISEAWHESVFGQKLFHLVNSIWLHSLQFWGCVSERVSELGSELRI